ncbi:MAG TPA: ATP synthase F1 subunit epsilon [Patescibacteria group bacterium]|nr:ATP synthase F1 subunit epsilon [Patescibacteria group bacterium]
MSHTFRLRIITPKKVVYEDEVSTVTAPSASGEITILHKHVPLFSLLREGAIKVKKENDEIFFSIGGGYLETDGKKTTVLVSRAYHQDEIDEIAVKKAQESAEKLIKESKTKEERHEAMMSLRRSVIDIKVIKRRRRSGVSKSIV